jgi:hypothetical protein
MKLRDHKLILICSLGSDSVGQKVLDKMLFYGYRKDAMASGRLLVHQRRRNAALVTAQVEALGQFFWTFDLDLFEGVDTDHAVLFFTDVDLFLLGDNTVEHSRSSAAIKQVDELLVVNLEEGTLYDKFSLALAGFNFIENKLVYSRDYAHIFLAYTYRVAASHCEGLS